MKTTLIFALCLISFSFIKAEEKYKTPLTQEMLDKIGVFLALDFAVLPDGDSRKKILSKYFYVEDGGNEPFEVEAYNDKDLKYIKNLGLELGKYKLFYVINEINGIGVVLRSMIISSTGNIYWCEEMYSLLEFEFQEEMGFMLGSVPLFKWEPKRIAYHFSQCQKGEIKFDYKPAKEELEFFKLKLRAFRRYEGSRI